MQLTIEVLPAPLGPIIENSSPSFTPKLTSVSARTPPKRSDTPRTSKACSTHSLHWRIFRFFQSEYAQSIQWRFTRSGFWRLPCSASRTYPGPTRHHIQLWGGGARHFGLGKWHFCIFCAEVPCKRSDFQPFLAHGLVVPEFGRCALEHDAAVAHDVDTMRYPHCDREFLLHQQNRDAAPGDLGEQVADLVYDQGSQSFGGLVDHDEFWVAHQRAANCQHLLLAARQHAGCRVRPRGEIGKHTKHVIESPFARFTRIFNAKHQILADHGAWKNVAMHGTEPHT